MISCNNYRGLLIGNKSETEENTLIISAMKISKRITKQKGKITAKLPNLNQIKEPIAT